MQQENHLSAGPFHHKSGNRAGNTAHLVPVRAHTEGEGSPGASSHLAAHLHGHKDLYRTEYARSIPQRSYGRPRNAIGPAYRIL